MMKPSLYLLFSFWLILTGQTFSSEDQYADVQINSQAMREGVDIGHFDIEAGSSPGRKRTVMQLTYSDGETPEQMETPTLAGAAKLAGSQKIIMTSNQLAKFYRVSGAIKVDVPIETIATVSGLLSGMYSTQKSRIEESHKSLAMSYLSIPKYRLKYRHSAIKYDHQFLSDLEAAKRNETTYDQITADYGTFVISEADFGGWRSANVYFSRNIYTTISREDVSLANNIVFSMLNGSVSSLTSFDTSTIEQAQELISTAEHDCIFDGGKGTTGLCFDEELRHEWESTIEASPRMISATLVPIYQLPGLDEHSEELKAALRRNLLTLAISKMSNQIANAKGRIQILAYYNELLSESEIDAFVEDFETCNGDRKFEDLPGCEILSEQAQKLVNLADLVDVFLEVERMVEETGESGYVASQFKRKDGVIGYCTSEYKHNMLQAKRNRRIAEADLLNLWSSLVKFVEDYPYGNFRYSDEKVGQVMAAWQMIRKMANLCELREYAIISDAKWFWCMGPLFEQRCTDVKRQHEDALHDDQ